MFGVELGYCADTLFLTTIFVWRDQLVVLCMFAVGRRGIKMGDLLSWASLPVLENTLKLPSFNKIIIQLLRTCQWPEELPCLGNSSNNGGRYSSVQIILYPFFYSFRNFFVLETRAVQHCVCSVLLVHGKSGMKQLNSGQIKIPFSKDKVFYRVKYNSWVMVYPLSLLPTLSPFEGITFKSCLVNTTQVVIEVVIKKELIKCMRCS